MTSALRPVPAFAIGLALFAAACGSTAGSPSGAATGATPGPSVPASTALLGSGQPPVETGAPSSTDAATCDAPAALTTAQTEGPYFKAGSPEAANLRTPGMAGTHLTLVGYVVTTDCTAVADAVVDIWQADANGSYDNAGYTLRGHVATDSSGRFSFETIVPGEYPGRTEHIHVKVTPPGGATLTTQLYFPGTAANDSDGIFSPTLLLDIKQSGTDLIGTYTFVLP